MTKTVPNELEWRTRRSRIDPRLVAAGWKVRAFRPGSPLEKDGNVALTEFPTRNGPADYALVPEGTPTGVVEAKRVSVDSENVLGQAERYSRGITDTPFNFDGLRVPFLYSSNGELIWFRDARHPLNRSREISGFHTPQALREMLDQDFDAACARLLATPDANPRSRPYQRQASAAIGRAISLRQRLLLVAMASGTGKTFLAVNEIYRLMKAGVARRVLFLVDRRALAAQAVRAFASFDAEPGLKFNQVYELYSNRFHRDDFGDEEPFNPLLMPSSYLTDPRPGSAFVYVSTIQRMAINLLGRGAIFDVGDEKTDEDADKLDMPIHAFDLIIADECHRGYTAAEMSVWRETLNHFDAIKVGLTATPAAHTTAYFGAPVFRYEYRQAVLDGYLVDYDVVTIKSDVRLHGIFLHEGEHVESVDTETGAKQLDLLEDEREFPATEVENRITSPDSNRKIIAEIAKYAHQHEELYGRFPKILIFAVNDLPFTSHAQQLVRICRETFGRGEAFVQKITGAADVDRPLQRIREFRNRPLPAIAVTVDMLTTGVDIPDLEFIVLLRPVKSRILFEQMLGRGTRKGEKFPDKSHFVVFDCFDGTLLQYFRETTGITADAPERSSRTITEVITAIWENRDREFNIRCLVKRLHRIAREMSGEAHMLFRAFIPDGDLARYARELPGALEGDFTTTMRLLRNLEFQRALVNYPRPKRDFYVAPGIEDEVSSQFLLKDANGNEIKPADYLEAFTKFVRENPARIGAIRILLDRPREWSASALTELRDKLGASPMRFSEDALRKAHESQYHRALLDIISMVKHAADEQQPLLTASERVARAFEKLTSGRSFTGDQQKWLERIRAHLAENLSISAEDFDVIPVFSREGGLSAARRDFGPQLDPLIRELNEAIAA